MAGKLKQTPLPGLEETEINIFTIGYGGRSFKEFQTALRTHGITQIIDVRSDNHTEYFGGEFMESFFGKDYTPIPMLGGKNWHQSQYQAWRAQAGVTEALEEIKEWSQVAKVAIMCAERDHRICHRFYFISRALKELGCEVQQI